MRELKKLLEKTLAAMKAGKDDISTEIADDLQDLERLKATKTVEYVSLTVIKIPDISESGVESLFKRR